MKKKSITINAVLNMLKTVSAIVFPLITFPYISRVLNVDLLGQYNFGASIVSYFALLSALGISNYAIREGSKIRDNRVLVSKLASEIYTLNIVSMVLSYFLLVVCVILVPKFHAYAFIIFILSFELLFTCIGISWIYNIFEEFWYITVVTILFQLVSLVLMFIFVKSEEDLLKYVGIVVLANCGSNIFYRAKARKNVDIKIIFNKSVFSHLKPVLILFSTSIVSMIYVSSDTTILGFLATDYNVGLYSVSTKIYKIVKQLFLAILVVAIPRVGMLLGNNRREECEELIEKVLSILLFLCVPAVVGLICISKYVVLIISGEEYIGAVSSLQILGIALIFAILSSFFANCVLIPMRKEKTLLIATFISAMVNIIGNIFLIPIYKENAAAFTTVLSELLMTLICGVNACKCIKIRINPKVIISTILGCVAIGVVCYLTVMNIQSLFLGFFVAVGGSMIAYSIIQVITGSPVTKMVFDLIKKYINKKRA